MATYKTFDSLNNKTLKLGDTVVFNGTRYVANRSPIGAYMENTKGYNDEIFDNLLIDEDKAAVKAYGYGPGCGSWPDCQGEDYEALTRLCLMLLAFIEGSEWVKIKMPDGNFKRVYHAFVSEL